MRAIFAAGVDNVLCPGSSWGRQGRNRNRGKRARARPLALLTGEDPARDRGGRGCWGVEMDGSAEQEGAPIAFGVAPIPERDAVLGIERRRRRTDRTELQESAQSRLSCRFPGHGLRLCRIVASTALWHRRGDRMSKPDAGFVRSWLARRVRKRRQAGCHRGQPQPHSATMPKTSRSSVAGGGVGGSWFGFRGPVDSSPGGGTTARPAGKVAPPCIRASALVASTRHSRRQAPATVLVSVRGLDGTL